MSGQARLRAAVAGRRALIPYVTAGDPDLATTDALLAALTRGGADVIELGIPFTDPMADGPILQAAAQRALKNPFSLDAILELAATHHARGGPPIVLFGYVNPFFRYGFERLAERAAACGVAGVLCVDLPPEEAEPLVTALDAYGLALIPLLTPTSTPDRIARVREVTRAFAYYVSVTGVTGRALEDSELESIATAAGEVQTALGAPLVIGFGVRTPKDVAVLGRHVAGVVVGSALVELAHRASPESRAAEAEAYVRSLRAG